MTKTSENVTIETGEVTVELAQDFITVRQSGNEIKLPWRAFVKLATAVAKLVDAHAALWRVNRPEADDK